MTPNNGPPRQPPNGSQAIIQQLAKQVSQLNLLANLFTTYMPDEFFIIVRRLAGTVAGLGQLLHLEHLADVAQMEAGEP